MAEKVIIDTDPGIDDAMAILLALRSPELEVIGLTSVFGNATIEVTTANALRLVELEGHQAIPVAQGCGQPLVLPLGEVGTYVHGEDGLGNTFPPPPKGRPLPLHAAQFILEALRRFPGEVTLLALGPLTNLALAASLDPEAVALARRVIIMGGAAEVHGNISPVAEANVYNDPHAAAIVFRAGWPVTMVGLDVTTRVVMTPDYWDGLYRAGNTATDFLRAITPFYQQFHDQFYGMGGATHTHDPTAVVYLLAPELFETRRLPVYVETQGRCMGQTVVDWNSQWKNLPRIDVCLGVDADGVLDLIRERLIKPVGESENETTMD
ncbi:MAG: nucleoside hydrolase [Thermanaerothrix sp.]|nr:nucleoside hydrolase [Thermanaerothrix sp.]